MTNVHHRRTCHNGERYAPQIIAQVLHADNDSVEAMEEVLHYVSQSHRDQQHRTHVGKNLEQRFGKGAVAGRLYQGEADGDQNGCEEVAQKGIGRHLLQTAA